MGFWFSIRTFYSSKSRKEHERTKKNEESTRISYAGRYNKHTHTLTSSRIVSANSF